MATILDFFLYNEISPKQILGPTGRTLEQVFKKRISAIIAILRDMEKNQTKPTLAMIHSLFEMEEPTKRPLILEKKEIEEVQPKFHERKNPNQ
ncbi:hypothetical protein GCM10007383_21620 [Arenibacter certesii]|uniref:Uncharacterized protein n=2 Tax=Arenibacter certesii TaxID=228955 RepID=A0A918IWL4_9FLAO|nr:hypothetical protein GCM10007383_21620 [Arenibacter certesii]